MILIGENDLVVQTEQGALKMSVLFTNHLFYWAPLSCLVNCQSVTSRRRPRNVRLQSV